MVYIFLCVFVCSSESELNSSKIKTEFEQTKAELAYERHRSEVLEKKLEQEIQKRYGIKRYTFFILKP